MHGALLRASAVRIRLLATARRKSGCLRYKAVRDVNGCAPLRGGGSVNPTVRASLYYCTARVWLCDMALRIGAAQSKLNHTPLLNGRENFISRPRCVNFKFNRAQRMSSRLVAVQRRTNFISWRENFMAPILR